MISVFINDIYRMKQEKARIILTFVMIGAAIAAAVFFASRPYSAGNIALAAEDGANTISSEILNITVLDEEPPFSELVRNRYDAVITADRDGHYEITTIKSESFKQELEQILTQSGEQEDYSGSGRGMAATILGYMTMFIMMLGVSMMFLFSDDKEKKQIERVAAAPISFSGYLAAHGIFIFGTIYLPSLIWLSIAAVIPGIDLGLPLWQYGLLLALICGVSVAFSLFLNSLIHGTDSANMTGSALTVLTSILAGGFYAFEEGNKILETVIRILPQKAFFTVVETVEANQHLGECLPSLLFIIIAIIGMVGFAAVKTRRDYVYSI